MYNRLCFSLFFAGQVRDNFGNLNQYSSDDDDDESARRLFHDPLERKTGIIIYVNFGSLHFSEF